MQNSKHVCAALLAHVDAGKTTLSEALLYSTGAIRKLGRVDHKDAFLDTDIQERQRGITIFSKQAAIKYDNIEITLLDTPGHADFSAEMERTLQVLDIAILVISGKDGIQGHTMTLWRLMKKYRLPVFIFVNKMDLDGTDRGVLLHELRKYFGSGCIEFDNEHDESWYEQIAMCDDKLIEHFLEKNILDQHEIAEYIAKRRIFPCCFGSALKMQGIDTLLKTISDYTLPKSYPEDFGARVYKITRDERGTRLTHMKITGGALSVKDSVPIQSRADKSTFLMQSEVSLNDNKKANFPGSSLDGYCEEKAEQIRIYSGDKYTTVDTLHAGNICAVAGFKETYAGQGLGYECDITESLLESVLSYQVILPEEIDVHTALKQLRILEEEDPQLHVIWNEQLQEIQIQLMGEVQIEILRNIIFNRFGFKVDFGKGSIAYKETIEEPVLGAGHFEPLRHYAEVHLLLEPAERGSGLTFETVCSSDELDTNWQRLIMTHLAEKEYVGTATGSPLTDMKITLIAGRAHLKHTEGGDFRQATYRAVRQGLRKAHMILLEPWYEFRLEVPQEMIGRAIADVQKMGGDIREPERIGENAVLRGRAPVYEMKDYAADVAAYTKGHGQLSCALCGYDKCHNQDEIVQMIGYNPDRDAENTADSVFCSHGAGFNVRWDQADQYMHLHPSSPIASVEDTQEFSYEFAGASENKSRTSKKSRLTDEEELERIFERTYGKRKEHKILPKREILSEQEQKKTKPAVVTEEYLLVDGYNIIFAWDELKSLAKVNLDSAREALIGILQNYQGYKKCHVIAVFDAYKVKGGERHIEQHGEVEVIYTQEAETADMYIEKAAHKKSRDYHVRVATSDRLEQLIVTGSGAFKVSADEFRLEIKQAELEIAELIEQYNRKNRDSNYNRIIIPESRKL